MSRMSELDIERQNLERLTGQLCISEAGLLALEARHDQFIRDGRHIREHLSHCEYGDDQALAGFDAMLTYIGILDEVKNHQPSIKPTAEMAVHEGD